MDEFDYKPKSKSSDLFNYPTDNSTYKLDYPIFCFKHLVKKYHIDKCDKKHKAELINRLTKLSQLGFSEIFNSHRHQYGSEKIFRKSLKFTLPKFITDDVDFLYAYRYNGNKNPFLAYRSPNSSILHIIAIDFNFSAYKHK